MDDTLMQELVDRHLRAEGDGDILGALAVYTEDIEHDVVGFPPGPTRGKQGAQDFYSYLTANFRTDGWDVLHRYRANEALVLEQLITGTVTGSLLGFAGHGRQIRFRILHVFEFRDGLICRENVWLDHAAVAAQLS